MEKPHADLVAQLQEVLGDGSVDLGETLNVPVSGASSGSGTTVPPTVAHVGRPRQAIHPLEDPQRPFEIILGDHIDSGGMADIDAAVQVSLNREVVVKRVKLAQQSAENTAALCREAQILGQLEHPHIPPIHELAVADQGPLVMMKRIWGTRWDLQLVGMDVDTQLAHLRNLVRICHAVEYAHSKGILHLDIKPANVMLGEFGEVYLMDWGCATYLAADGKVYPKGFQGTPQYAAPEMFEEENALTSQTDVYLLGATLHHILTGRGPHLGAEVLQVVLSALQSTPAEYPDEVAGELVELAHRAMARLPEDRFATVAAFREAIETYLRDFHLSELLRSARSALQAATDLFAGEREDFFSFYQHVFEGQFACRRVLESRRDDMQAQEVLLRLLLLLARHEISVRHMITARAVLKQLPRMDAWKQEVAEVEALYQKAESEQQRAGELTTQIQYKLLEQLQADKTKKPP